MKSYTDIEQSKTLAKILPLESADMRYGYTAYDGCYDEIPYPKDFLIKNLNYSPNEYDAELPCWSLVALLEVLPKKYYPVKDHETTLILGKPKDEWCALYWDTTGMQDGEQTLGDNPIDACYEMIIRLYKLNLL